jgi:hypothetical protein
MSSWNHDDDHEVNHCGGCVVESQIICPYLKTLEKKIDAVNDKKEGLATDEGLAVRLAIFDEANGLLRKKREMLQWQADAKMKDWSITSPAMPFTYKSKGIEAIQTFQDKEVTADTLLLCLQRMWKDMRVALKRAKVVPWAHDGISSYWLCNMECVVKLKDDGAVQLQDQFQISVTGTFYINEETIDYT